LKWADNPLLIASGPDAAARFSMGMVIAPGMILGELLPTVTPTPH
jgi:hypothetical protein